MSAPMPDQQPSPNVAEFFSPGPGERLRAARLSMGFDLAKIASELHLTSAVVERLEADDYPAVGARVFVRGYLRNYARIVEMPVESILRQFNEKWPDETPTHSMLRESPRLPADGGPSRGVAGAMSWFLVIGALVLFVIWWRGYLDDIVPEQIRSGTLQEPALDRDTVDFEQPAFTDTQPTDAIGSDGSLRLPSLSDAPVSSILNEVATDSPAVEASSGTSLETPILSTTEPAETASEAAAVSSESVAPPVLQSITTRTAPTAEMREAAQSTADGGAPVVDGATGIVMTFSAPCWVDVRDSTRKFKLFGEMPKGARRVLGGDPPYKLVIGNARAVTISVNGEPFDLAPYAKGNVARFTLNP